MEDEKAAQLTTGKVEKAHARHVIPCCPMLSHVIPRYPTLSHVIPCYPMPRRAAVLSHAAGVGGSHSSGLVGAREKDQLGQEEGDYIGVQEIPLVTCV